MRMGIIASSVSTSVLLVVGLAGGAASAVAPSTVYVSTENCSDSGPGTQRTPYCTVQKGLDSVAAGGTVNVAKGTYPEQITLSKNNVTLKGAGDKTVIQEPSSNTAGGKIVDIQSQGSTIRNLSVSGPFNVPDCGESMYGIYFENGSNATISNTDVTNIVQSSSALIGCQQGVGIRVGSEALGIVAKATINKDTVSNYAKGGIVVDGPGSSASISQSTITGMGPTNQTATNGIQIGRGATASVTQNKVTGNEYTGDGGVTTATGILIFSDSNITQNLTVNQNAANNNDVGLDIDARNSTFNQNNANSNTTNGLFVESTAQNNSFHQTVAHNNSGNTHYTPYDIEDDSTGSGTLGTANTWHQNDCKTSLPALLCKQ